MQNIMFVCTGNICRSAMAENMLKKRAKEENLPIKVYSCGTYAENGDRPTEEAIETMNEYGIDITNHRATNIYNSNIENMDIILCATANHKRVILDIYPNLTGKVFTMKEYVGDTENGIDISDPWGYGLFVYRKCATEINKVVEKIIEREKEGEHDGHI